MVTEWEYRKFVDTFDFLPNNTYARNQMTDSKGKYINIHYGDVLIKYGAVLDLERDEVPLLKDGIEITNKKMFAQDGDIIIADTAEDNTVGKMIELFHVGNRKVVAGLHTILCRPKYDEFSPRWLGYFMNSASYHNQLLPFVTGIKVSSISKSNIGETMIAIPSKIEQTAIATALSDTDALIDSLEKLIAKKQAIKQGAMQELLTGKRRLKGFCGEWKRILIGSCFEFKNGLNKAKDYFGVGTPIVNYMDVYSKNGLHANDIHGKVTLSNAEINRYDVRRGDVFFTRTSETPEEVGIASVMLEDIEECVFSGFILRARPKTDILYEGFCKYCFSTANVREQIISNCTYTTRALTNGKTLSKITLKVPEKEEQIAITTILDDMDDEISALQKNLDKVRHIKQGMMAELLTGRIRLN